MTPQDQATFAAAPKSINNDILVNLSSRYTPSQIAAHANAGRAAPVLSASNVSERLYASIGRIARRDGRSRTEVRRELVAARWRALARRPGSIIGAGVLDPGTDEEEEEEEEEDGGGEVVEGRELTAGDLLRAIEGPKPLTNAEVEALRRFDETADVEDNIEMAVEDDVAMAAEALLAAVEGPEPMVYVETEVNQAGSAVLVKAHETMDQSNTDAAARIEAGVQRLAIDDVEPSGHTANGSGAGNAEGSSTLSSPSARVNGFDEDDEVHVMGDVVVEKSVRG
ncbi:hypothetical protein LTR02_010603 [Friedmanniomyces endolithicus]|nr:hypothetical protein LTR94_022283 [Friedmanniomyces endolithicus]KAK0769046.1 hypothetical protein LTR59_017253 [Friedmanniomyces endolithicus]KAK0774161.1 hypothetical protein LTR38_016320 [Friedmanniomyces endolithicus]KAK0801076.1 hypothetical protein LTR75_008708 [Friedmanniomyces endolithicus]KAK0838709.1 hypothetical protein LTR03_011795 [Friedmanniomyces endolithicus]